MLLKSYTQMDEEGWFVLHKEEIWLTTCTHSMRGSLTAMFPDKLTTHAGVSGVASSRAITASTPILLAWIMTVKKQELGKAGTLVFIHIVTRNKTHFCSLYGEVVVIPGFCQRQKGFLLSEHGPRWWCGCRSLASLIPAGQRLWFYEKSASYEEHICAAILELLCHYWPVWFVRMW